MSPSSTGRAGRASARWVGIDSLGLNRSVLGVVWDGLIAPSLAGEGEVPEEVGVVRWRGAGSRQQGGLNGSR